LVWSCMVIGGEDSSVGVVAIVKKFGDETELGNNLGFKFRVELGNLILRNWKEWRWNWGFWISDSSVLLTASYSSCCVWSLEDGIFYWS
jgi:hypothetical protein